MNVVGQLRAALLITASAVTSPALAQTPVALLPVPTEAPVASPTPNPAPNDGKTAFQERYAELRTAMQLHDAAAIDKLVSPDFSLTDIRGGIHTRGDMINHAGRMGRRGNDQAPQKKDGKGRPQRPERKINQTVLSVAVDGDTATVDQQLAMNGPREDEDGNEHAMEMTMRATDTWTKRDGAWLLKSSVQKDITVKRDGDVVFHQGS